MPVVRIIDLFAGAGGLTQGFVSANEVLLKRGKNVSFEPVLAVEIDGDAVATYEANFGGNVFSGDIAELGAADIPQADIVIGGPPCQGFSPLGKMTPGERRQSEHESLNGLWKEYMRIVKIANPAIFVMENVPQLLRSKEFLILKKTARAMGYEIDSGVLNAVEYGVPQARRRAFVVGSRIGKPSLPAPTGERMTVRDAIGHMPLEPTEENWHLSRNPTAVSLERYKVIPPGGNRFDLMRERPDITPPCWLRKKTGSTDVFGRLEWDKPALTIRTEFFKPEKGRYLHPEAHRSITHREAALLQTFPENFEFSGSRISVARQIGNAVPPKLALHVALELSKLIETDHNDNESISEMEATA